MSEYEEAKADLILRLFESYGVEMNEAQRKHIRRELLMLIKHGTCRLVSSRQNVNERWKRMP